MTSARTRAALRRGAIALLVWAVLMGLAALAFRLYGKSRLATAEDRFLGDLEGLLTEPTPSSAESRELTPRLLAAAAEVTADWPYLKADFHTDSPELLTRIAPQLDTFLAAAEVAPAHETIAASDGEGVDLLRAARLLSRAADEAAQRGDEARQVRCAAALSAIAGSFYRLQNLSGVIMGGSVEQMELVVVQRLVEAPTTSPEALDRAAALLAAGTPRLHASFAGETLGLVRSEVFSQRRPLASAPFWPLQDGLADLMRARVLERSREIVGDIDRPLLELMNAEPESEARNVVDLLAGMIEANTRDALVKAKTLATIRELGLEAVAARRAGRPGELGRPEVRAAYDRRWRWWEGKGLPPGAARTRGLLTWRLPG